MQRKIFDSSHFVSLAETVAKIGQSEKLLAFSGMLTISQTVRYFEVMGIEFTKTMIQNYVRVEVLPPPHKNRYYTRDHIILLFIINNLKGVYSLEEIKKATRPILNDMSTSDDDKIGIAEIFDIYNEMFKKSMDRLSDSLPEISEEVADLIEKNGVESDDREVAQYFTTILTLMAQSLSIKRLVSLMIKDYSDRFGG